MSRLDYPGRYWLALPAIGVIGLVFVILMATFIAPPAATPAATDTPTPTATTTPDTLTPTATPVPPGTSEPVHEAADVQPSLELNVEWEYEDRLRVYPDCEVYVNVTDWNDDSHIVVERGEGSTYELYEYYDRDNLLVGGMLPFGENVTVYSGETGEVITSGTVELDGEYDEWGSTGNGHATKDSQCVFASDDGGDSGESR